MTTYIEIGLKDSRIDTRGKEALHQAQTFLNLPVNHIQTRTVYKFSFDLAAADLATVLAAISDPVLEEAAAGQLPTPPCDWIITIGFLPGVTDNVGQTALLFVADMLPGPLPQDGRICTEIIYYLLAPRLTPEQVRQLATDILANQIIQTIKICSRVNYERAPLDVELPTPICFAPRVETIPLPDQDEQLLHLSVARTLSLSLLELKAIRQYYQQTTTQIQRSALGLPPDPTDVELEVLAQTWSEHCKHKIFNAHIHYRDECGNEHTIHSLFKTYIVKPTQTIAQRVPWLVSVFDDNAGVVRLNACTNLVYKVETHNSPSALDPYGGAITGIVGVNRDPLGTGLGAALLTNVWGYCFASPFYQEPIPEGLLHPHRIREGVHKGVIDGGNQSGIPYSRGFEYFDDHYLGKPLVFCGTVGVMPATIAGRPSISKKSRRETSS